MPGFRPVPSDFPSDIMADAPAGRRRRVAHADEGEQGRSVRARMTEAEGRLDSVESTLGRHETRLQYVEAPLRVVLRGFSCVQEFLRVLREDDMRRAKTAFIPSLRRTLREVWPRSSPLDRGSREPFGGSAGVGGDRRLPDRRYVGR